MGGNAIHHAIHYSMVITKYLNRIIFMCFHTTFKHYGCSKCAYFICQQCQTHCQNICYAYQCTSCQQLFCLYHYITHTKAIAISLQFPVPFKCQSNVIDIPSSYYSISRYELKKMKYVAKYLMSGSVNVIYQSKEHNAFGIYVLNCTQFRNISIRFIRY